MCAVNVRNQKLSLLTSNTLRNDFKMELRRKHIERSFKQVRFNIFGVKQPRMWGQQDVRLQVRNDQFAIASNPPDFIQPDSQDNSPLQFPQPHKASNWNPPSFEENVMNENSWIEKCNEDHSIKSNASPQPNYLFQHQNKARWQFNRFIYNFNDKRQLIERLPQENAEMNCQMPLPYCQPPNISPQFLNYALNAPKNQPVSKFQEPEVLHPPSKFQADNHVAESNSKPVLDQNFSRLPKEKRHQRYPIKTRHQGYIVFDKIIGQGAYSKVYLGFQVENNMQLAIKEVSQLQDNEIKCLNSVDSPYVIKLKANWRDNRKGVTYLALELCERNLREQLKQLNRDQADQDKTKALAYFDHVVMGMKALVSKQLVHRDLKFENILVSKDGVAKITDFGLAKDLGNLSNVASLRCGTPYTMAPEILFHNGYGRPLYNHKCDIWSMGVILHQVLYCKHPFQSKSERVLTMNRVKVQKKFGKYDKLIDLSLVKDPLQRIGWAEFLSIHQQPTIPHKLTIQQPITHKEVLNSSLSHNKQNPPCIPCSNRPDKANARDLFFPKKRMRIGKSPHDQNIRQLPQPIEKQSKQPLRHKQVMKKQIPILFKQLTRVNEIRAHPKAIDQVQQKKGQQSMDEPFTGHAPTQHRYPQKQTKAMHKNPIRSAYSISIAINESRVNGSSTANQGHQRQSVLIKFMSSMLLVLTVFFLIAKSQEF